METNKKTDKIIKNIYKEIFNENPSREIFHTLLLEIEKIDLSLQELAVLLGKGPHIEIERRKWELLPDPNNYYELDKLFPDNNWVIKRIKMILEEGLEVDINKFKWILEIFTKKSKDDTVRDLYGSSIGRFLLDQVDTIFPYLLKLSYGDLVVCELIDQADLNFSSELTEALEDILVEMVDTIRNFLICAESDGEDQKQIDKAIGYLKLYGTWKDR